MPNTGWRQIAIGLLSGLLLAASTAGANRTEPLSTPQLLVDLARHHALDHRGERTDADIAAVRTLLKAAVRLDPGLVDAHTFLYELALLDGDTQEAALALTGLLRADPQHERAFALWLDAGARAQHTAEKQKQWLEAVLATNRPPNMKAIVHLHLARIALERMDLPVARHHVEQAWTLSPTSIDAAVLRIETLPEDSPPATQFTAALHLLELQPLSVDAAWRAALILDGAALLEEADEFWRHVRTVQEKLAARGGLPGRLLLDLAFHHMAQGRLDHAADACRQVIQTDPRLAAEAGLFLLYLLERAGHAQQAAEVRAQLVERFAALRDPAEYPVNEVAQAAWFYAVVGDQPDRALMLAKAAAARAPNDVFVQRVLGWAQRANGHVDEARRILEPIARVDPYACYLVAKLQHDEGDRAAMDATLAALERVPVAGLARDLIAELNAVGAASEAPPASQPATRPVSSVAISLPPPAPPLPPAGDDAETLRAALREFDRRVLAFVARPDAFVQARIALDDPSPAPGEPWWATFAITNRAPFPITLGPDAMLNPVFVVSLTMEGDRERVFPGLFTISLDRTFALKPGQTASLRRTLNAGPPHTASRRTPQQLQRVRLDAVLDAETGAGGGWQVGVTGQRLGTVYFNRIPASTGREAIGALFGALAGENRPRQFLATEVLAELLGEAQRAQLRDLGYRPAPVPTDRLREALLALLTSDSWELRVRVLEGAQLLGLDREMFAAVEHCLEHEHWLVRLMALRVLARQGPRFADRARQIAENDADELVRALARSYVQRSQTAADTSPAGNAE